MRIGIEAQHIFRAKKQSNDYIVLGLLKALQKTDKINEYLIFVRPDIDRCIDETSNFRIVDIPAAPEYVWTQFYLPQTASLEKCDVLHCTGLLTPAYSKVPVITTIIPELHLGQTRLFHFRFQNHEHDLSFATRLLLPRMIKGSKYLICFSQSQKRELLHYYDVNEEKIEIIFPGIHPLFLKPKSPVLLDEIRKKYHLPLKFVYVNGLHGTTKEIIEKVSLLTELCLELLPDYNIIVPLNIPAQLKLNQYHLSPNVKKTVQFIRGVHFGDLPYIFTLTRLFININSNNNASMTILGALACQVPVISVYSPMVKEFTASSDLQLIEKGSSSFLSDLRKQIKDYQNEQVPSSFEELQTNFSSLNMASSILNVYSKFIH